ncbi:MAG: hypothetical protein ACI828_001803 [Flavobacteriales bacterium]|jgi:hypothetical protein
MKILHKTLLLGVFLLISAHSFAQNNSVNPEQPISILNESTTASLVIEFSFVESKEIEMIVFDLNEVVVKKKSWKDLRSTVKKLDFSELKNGAYHVRFYDQTNLVFEKKVSKI